MLAAAASLITRTCGKFGLFISLIHSAAISYSNPYYYTNAVFQCKAIAISDHEFNIYILLDVKHSFDGLRVRKRQR